MEPQMSTLSLPQLSYLVPSMTIDEGGYDAEAA
jgi:hypothetical protein